MIDGEFEFFDGESWVSFHRGEAKCSLRGNYHGFRNIGQSAGKMMFTTNGGGLDEYFAAISSLRLPEDMECFQEISNELSANQFPHCDTLGTVECYFNNGNTANICARCFGIAR